MVSSTIFKVFGMTRPGIEPRSPGPLANTLTAGPMSRFQFSIGSQFKYKLTISLSRTFLSWAIQFSQTVLIQTIQFRISIGFVQTWHTVSLYHNSPVWLDRQDTSSWDRNQHNFTLNLVSYRSAYRQPTGIFFRLNQEVMAMKRYWPLNIFPKQEPCQ